MSLENARELVSKMADGDEAVRSLLEVEMPSGISRKEALAIVAKAAVADGWDVTADELEEASVLEQEVDDEELEAVAGGGNGGNCVRDYFEESCYSTVGDLDWCMKNDECVFIYHEYTVATGPVVSY